MLTQTLSHNSDSFPLATPKRRRGAHFSENKDDTYEWRHPVVLKIKQQQKGTEINALFFSNFRILVRTNSVEENHPAQLKKKRWLHSYGYFIFASRTLAGGDAAVWCASLRGIARKKNLREQISQIKSKQKLLQW